MQDFEDLENGKIGVMFRTINLSMNLEPSFGDLVYVIKVTHKVTLKTLCFNQDQSGIPKTNVYLLST